MDQDSAGLDSRSQPYNTVPPHTGDTTLKWNNIFSDEAEKMQQTNSEGMQTESVWRVLWCQGPTPVGFIIVHPQVHSPTDKV